MIETLLTLILVCLLVFCAVGTLGLMIAAICILADFIRYWRNQ